MNKNNFLLTSIIAHRGVHYKYLENTIPAFWEAIKRNYIIELDVRLTKDKEVIVFHDSNLKRIFQIDRDIKDLTYKELKQYKYISTLKEVLEIVNGQVPIIIDIKLSKGLTKHLIKILDKYKGKFSIQSFNPIIIYYFKLYRPKYLRGYIVHKFTYSKSLLTILKPNYLVTNLTNLDNLSKYRKKYPIIGYTIKNKYEYYKYKNHADNFICDISR